MARNHLEDAIEIVAELKASGPRLVQLNRVYEELLRVRAKLGG